MSWVRALIRAVYVNSNDSPNPTSPQVDQLWLVQLMMLGLPYYLSYYISFIHFQVAEMYKDRSLGVDVNIAVAKILVLKGDEVKCYYLL